MKMRRPLKIEIMPLRQVKKAAIVAAVQQLNGDIPLAAEKLQISETTLRRKIEEYGAASKPRRRRR
jgi:DNA-binding NtrC family response regulator